MSEYYVYTLADPATRRIFYVGKGKGSRWLHHEWAVKAGRVPNHNKHLGRKIAKILRSGNSIAYDKPFESDEAEEAYLFEEILIRFIGLGNLANLTHGGKGSRHSPESCAKISAARKGMKFSDSHRAAIARAQTGKKRGPKIHSEETKRKISESKKGKKASPETCAKRSVTLKAIGHRPPPMTPEWREKQIAATIATWRRRREERAAA